MKEGAMDCCSWQGMSAWKAILLISTIAVSFLFLAWIQEKRRDPYREGLWYGQMSCGNHLNRWWDVWIQCFGILFCTFGEQQMLTCSQGQGSQRGNPQADTQILCILHLPASDNGWYTLFVIPWKIQAKICHWKLSTRIFKEIWKACRGAVLTGNLEFQRHKMEAMTHIWGTWWAMGGTLRTLVADLKTISSLIGGSWALRIGLFWSGLEAANRKLWSCWMRRRDVSAMENDSLVLQSMAPCFGVILTLPIGCYVLTWITTQLFRFESSVSFCRRGQVRVVQV